MSKIQNNHFNEAYVKNQNFCFMEEKELKAVFAENIKKFHNRKGWNQLLTAEKLEISLNFLSEIKTEKGWVSPLTLVKLANALEIEVFELFLPKNLPNTAQDTLENEKMKRFVKDLALALDATTNEVNNFIKNTVAKISKEYLC
jgi:transcriptional regulator with XRE-family HTH domain